MALTERELQILLAEARTLAAWDFESLSNLQYIPYIREFSDAGTSITVRAEARIEVDKNGGEAVVVPVELWRGEDVRWVHIFASQTVGIRLDEELCPPEQHFRKD